MTKIDCTRSQENTLHDMYDIVHANINYGSWVYKPRFLTPQKIQTAAFQHV